MAGVRFSELPDGGALQANDVFAIARGDFSRKILGSDLLNRFINLQTQIDSFNPFTTGMILMWSGTISTIPTGWSLCDGTSGTPNLTDKFIVGAGNTYTPGDTGGANSVTLTVNQIPSHNHGGSTGNDSPDHSHGGVMRYPGGMVEQNQSGGPDGPRSNYAQQTDGANTRHTHSITAQGGGQAHENRPPYYALAYIMKL